MTNSDSKTSDNPIIEESIPKLEEILVGF